MDRGAQPSERLAYRSAPSRRAAADSLHSWRHRPRADRERETRDRTALYRADSRANSAWLRVFAGNGRARDHRCAAGTGVDLEGGVARSVTGAAAARADPRAARDRRWHVDAFVRF